MKIDEKICAEELIKIARSEDCNRQQAEFVMRSINSYFGEFKRNQCFREADLALSPKFGQMLKHFSNEEGVDFASHYFLFSYTLAETNYKHCQLRIEAEVAQPYLHWVRDRWAGYRTAVNGIGQGEEMVFLCRHALTQGMYAPGKSTFTFIKALLETGEKVTLLVLGQVGDEFRSLANNYANFTLARLTATSIKQKFESLIAVLTHVRPKAVMTEIEFDIASVLAILQPQFPVILLSAGFYNLPWYDKIGLTDTLADSPVGQRHSDFFIIPTYVSHELLNPHFDVGDIKSVKSELGLTDDDVVIGSFARMEKFSEAFGSVLKDVLDKRSKAKILLAGPNDQTRIRQAIKPYADTNRALLFGQSNVHLLGQCVDIAVDTFPLHSGFSMLELMAKNVPVVAKNDEGIDGYWKQRLQELLCTSEGQMVDLLCKLIDDEAFRQKCSQKTNLFMKSQQQDAVFVNALRDALAA